MADYTFSTLSPHDFEVLGRDLVQALHEIRFESFTAGRDKGIDFRRGTGRDAWILQCKHYAGSGYPTLLSKLKRVEVDKVKELKPAKYLLATSVGLTPGNKDELVKLFHPYCKTPDDILGKGDLNNLLTMFPHIERSHFKLWLASSDVLDRLVHSEVLNRSAVLLDEIETEVKRYVPNLSLPRAREILDKEHVCIIIGVPGIGKTLLARILALEYASRDFDVIEVSADIAEAFEVLNPARAQFFYYDDFLGQTNLAESLHKNEENRLLSFMRTVAKASNKVLVLTTREYIFERARMNYESLGRVDLSFQKCVLALEDYSRFDRALILYNHVYFSSLSPDAKRHFARSDAYEPIIDHRNFNPRIIDVIIDRAARDGRDGEGTVALMKETLDNPQVLWSQVFESQLGAAERWLLLILATLPRDVVVSDLQEAFNTLRKRRGEAKDPVVFRHALKTLEGTFVSISATQDLTLASFQNPSIRDFLLAHIDGDPDSLLELVQGFAFFDQCHLLWRYAYQPRVQRPTTVESLIAAGAFDGMRSVLEQNPAVFDDAVIRVFDSPDCEIGSYRQGVSVRRERRLTSVEDRLSIACGFLHEPGGNRLKRWISTRIVTLINEWTVAVGDSSAAMSLLARLSETKAVSEKMISRLAEAIRVSLVRAAETIEDFEALQDFDENELLLESERAQVADNFRLCVGYEVDYLTGHDFGYSTLSAALDDLISLAEWFGVEDVDDRISEFGEYVNEVGAHEDMAEEMNRDAYSSSGGGSVKGSNDGDVHGLFSGLGDDG